MKTRTSCIGTLVLTMVAACGGGGGGGGAGNAAGMATADPAPAATPPPAGPDWEPVASLSVPRSSPRAVALGGRIYVYGGSAPDGTPLDSMEVYDPEADRWTASKTLPGPTNRPGAVVDGNLVVMADARSVWAFDPVADTWRVDSATSGPGAALTDAAPYIGSALGVGPLIVGLPVGTNADEMTRLYDPRGRSWLTVGEPAVGLGAIRRYSVEVVGDRLLVLGGAGRTTGTGPRASVDDIWSLSLTGARWTRSGPLSVPRSDHASDVSGDRVYIVGGRSTECEDAEAGPDPDLEFAEVRPPSNCRRGPPRADGEMHQVAAGTRKALPKMLEARERHAAVILDGRLYAIGGNGLRGSLESVERLDVSRL